ncbi:SPAG1 [Symbiodinium sp. CCMP2592]|nr:SPAG1 [Symbiodinium sp. CCMP2592]
MLQAITPESKRSQAKALKEEGNDLAKQGEKAEALKKYEKGIRLLGLLNYELDDEGLKAFEAQTEDGRELLSILAANAAQMYMDPANRQLSKAIQRCSLAIDANPNNAKALFRRASAAYDYADNVAKGADAILAQAQRDIRKFLQMDQAWLFWALRG